MLYINDERIDFQEVIEYTGTDPLKVFLKAKITEIKNGPQRLHFKYREGVIRRNKKEGIPEGKKISFSWDDPVVSNRGPELWVWATGRVKKPNGVFRYTSPTMMFTKDLWLDRDRDLDRILFVLYASSYVRTGLIILENEENEAKNRITTNVDKDELKVLVLRTPLEKLRKLGSAFQIENAQTLGEYVLREAILGKADLMVSTGKRGYLDIIQLIRSDEQTSMRANIQKAKDMGILLCKNLVYGFADEKGSIVEPIIQVPVKREFEKEEVLIAYLEENRDQYKRLISEIEAVENLVPAGPAKEEKEEEDEAAKEEILAGITTYVIANGKLPFEAGDKERIKEVAKLVGIPGMKPGSRPYAKVYEELQGHFVGA